MAKIRLAGSYPEQEVRKALEDFWDEVVDPAMTADLGLAPGAALDSLTATDVLLTMESVLGLQDQELPQTLVKSGGYDSKDEFVEHLTGCIRECVS
jgi:hypothetical protein